MSVPLGNRLWVISYADSMTYLGPVSGAEYAFEECCIMSLLRRGKGGKVYCAQKNDISV